ncbi:MAG: efflux transporter outer membrane subunit [Planctomycetota bacterium]
MNNLKATLCLSLGVIACLSGCSLAPSYVRPKPSVPTTLPSGPAYAPPQAMPGDVIPDKTPWQEFLVDQRLRKIVALALENNRNLRIAALNVERARAIYGIERADLFPALNATGTLAKEHIPAGLSGTGKAFTSEQYGANLGVASWEIDFFGRIRSLTEAALQEYLATQQARRGVEISLIAEVASAYLALAADRESLRLAQTTLESHKDAYALVKHRYERGVAPELDVHRAQTQVDTADRSVAQFTQQVAQDQNALDLLAGGPVPGDLLPTDLAHVLPPREISPGLSSAVLLQRPDILEAENRLKAANANIGAARAAFFPRVTLTAAAGAASSDLSGLFKSGSGTWAFAPQVVVPVFDPRTWSAVKVTETDKQLAIDQYKRAIQVSFKEVADALAVRGTIGQQVASQESLVKAVSETYRLSFLRYTKGVDSYLSVLDSQRSLYAAQQGLVLLRLARLTNRVRLYAVMGGG